MKKFPPDIQFESSDTWSATYQLYTSWYFVKGTKGFRFGGIFIRPNPEIIIVRQRNIIKTIYLLVHELLHYLNWLTVGRGKIDDWIDDVDIKIERWRNRINDLY